MCREIERPLDLLVCRQDPSSAHSCHVRWAVRSRPLVVVFAHSAHETMNASTAFLIALVGYASAAHFYVKDPVTNTSCIVLDGDFTFTLNFFELTTNETKTYTAKLNETNTVTGDCNASYNGKPAQTLNISFYPDGVSPLRPKDWTLNLVFNSPINATFKLVDYTLESQITDNIPYFGTFTKDPQSDEGVTAEFNNAYKCSSSKLALNGGSYVTVSGVKAIANAHVNGTDFSDDTQYQVCLGDQHTSDIVPIVVGACLAALVIIVLVAYLIGRARAKRQGYASV
ncbi:unnamed protein product [Caenorhabditis auriculariae]|uniref:Lysosome-associated membrane glycoprotein 2-like transmembrane domain-containing protein n=1 Tax=Caenorhabditis auriculariae TaxID=2777116 RepID=A0A8S1GY46_9PELO|nr:unnamed protein product [Caenorhabditis auriculariae]